MRNRLPLSLFRRTVLSVLLFALFTPLLHANDLFICKASDSSTTLQNQVFTFDITGGNLSGTVKEFVAVGKCVFVARGPNLVYTITEEASSNSTLTSVTASGINNGVVVNGLVTPWVFPSRTAIAKVFTGSTYVHFTNSAKVGLAGRFTGGGSTFTSTGNRVTHGFQLHCNPQTDPTNSLEINFESNRFHLTSLTSANCFINQAGVAIIVGSGVGTFGPVSTTGATTVTTNADHSGGGSSGGYGIDFTFTDTTGGTGLATTIGGTPNDGTGINDFAAYTITSPTNVTILSTGNTEQHGNQVYHPMP